jgi:hypothetical protein
LATAAVCAAAATWVGVRVTTGVLVVAAPTPETTTDEPELSGTEVAGFDRKETVTGAET